MTNKQAVAEGEVALPGEELAAPESGVIGTSCADDQHATHFSVKSTVRIIQNKPNTREQTGERTARPDQAGQSLSLRLRGRAILRDHRFHVGCVLGSLHDLQASAELRIRFELGKGQLGIGRDALQPRAVRLSDALKALHMADRTHFWRSRRAARPG